MDFDGDWLRDGLDEGFNDIDGVNEGLGLIEGLSDSDTDGLLEGDCE